MHKRMPSATEYGKVSLGQLRLRTTTNGRKLAGISASKSLDETLPMCSLVGVSKRASAGRSSENRGAAGSGLTRSNTLWDH